MTDRNGVSLLRILTLPDKGLREVCLPLVEFDEALSSFAETMAHTMVDADGLGLAAPQVGHAIRLFVLNLEAASARDARDLPEASSAEIGQAQCPMEASGTIEGENWCACVNPQIVERSDTLTCLDEGCLSIPDITVPVTRPESVILSYQDLNGEHHQADCDGILARCIQHELDHLDGRLIIDYLSRLKRSRITQKFVRRQSG